MGDTHEPTKSDASPIACLRRGHFCAQSAICERLHHGKSVILVAPPCNLAQDDNYMSSKVRLGLRAAEAAVHDPSKRTQFAVHQIKETWLDPECQSVSYTQSFSAFFYLDIQPNQYGDLPYQKLCSSHQEIMLCHINMRMPISHLARMWAPSMS